MIQAGYVAGFTRTLTQRDFDRFAALSGDDNPIHVDPEFAARTRFGRTVAHGMFLYSLLWRAVRSIPGMGEARHLSQALMFPTPTYAGEEVAVRVEVDRVSEDGLATLDATVTRPSGEISCRGTTEALLPLASLQEAMEGSSPAGLAETYPGSLLSASSSEAHSLGRLALGRSASTRRTFTEADLTEYRDLVGETASLSEVPGPLLGGLFSYLLGTRLPGRGTNWLKQEIGFLAPARPGEPVDATVEIVRLRPEKSLADLRTVCTASGGRPACQGRALVYVGDLEDRGPLIEPPRQ